MRSRKSVSQLIPVTVAFCLAPQCRASTIYSFQTFQVCTTCSTVTIGLNNNGQVSGTTADSMGNTQGFLRTGNMITTFTVPMAMLTFAGGVNNMGQVGGDYIGSDGIDRPYIRNANGTINLLTGVPGATVSSPNVITDNGHLLGSTTSDPMQSSGFKAFLFDGASYSTFSVPFANVDSTFGNGMNAAGVIVGSFRTTAGIEHGYIRQTNGMFQQLDFPGSVQSEAFGINNAGLITGRYQDSMGIQHGFTLLNGIYTPFDYVDANHDPNTYIWGVNDKGQIAGWSFPGDPYASAGIAFVATPAPEPGTVLLFLGAIGMFRARRVWLSGRRPSATTVRAVIAIGAFASVLLAGLVATSHHVHAGEDFDTHEWEIQTGLRIAPVPLNLLGKDVRKVGLGSFLVNALADCNACHGMGMPVKTNYVPGFNPYFGQPKLIDPATYLGGGRDFGEIAPGAAHIVSRNLTPDKTGMPAGGMTFDRFLLTIRTGVDLDHLHPECTDTVNPGCVPPPFDGSLLQTMPWPTFAQLSDRDLRAIYEYLSAIPCISGPPAPSLLHNDCN